MGLKCSFLGHSYEDAGVERDREEQGSEVVTVVKELEQCRRCGEERVVSESTEVTTVVDPDEIDADVDGRASGHADGAGRDADRAGGDADRAGGDADRAGGHADDPAAKAAANEAAAAVDELAEDPDENFEARDPEEEDAEILTDDDAEREPGEWPDDPVDEANDPEGALDEPDSPDDADVPDDAGEPSAADPVDERGDGQADVDEESLSGITVPEGRIVCPECGFEVDAESSYRDGDPCPDCGAWLLTVPE